MADDGAIAGELSVQDEVVGHVVYPLRQAATQWATRAVHRLRFSLARYQRIKSRASSDLEPGLRQARASADTLLCQEDRKGCNTAMWKGARSARVLALLLVMGGLLPTHGVDSVPLGQPAAPPDPVASGPSEPARSQLAFGVALYSEPFLGETAATILSRYVDEGALTPEQLRRVAQVHLACGRLLEDRELVAGLSAEGGHSGGDAELAAALAVVCLGVEAERGLATRHMIAAARGGDAEAQLTLYYWTSSGRAPVPLRALAEQPLDWLTQAVRNPQASETQRRMAARLYLLDKAENARSEAERVRYLETLAVNRERDALVELVESLYRAAMQKRRPLDGGRFSNAQLAYAWWKAGREQGLLDAAESLQRLVTLEARMTVHEALAADELASRYALRFGAVAATASASRLD